ncbi:MAG: putative rane-bound dehydrogenase [Phycisphaerales bacterium]|nr:putative rane-bound dehydrogenase [Phycisphaerales bacterium]
MRSCVWVLFLTVSCAAVAQDVKPGQRDRKEQGSPLPLDKSAAAMTLPDGFSATLFAGEPDVHQPIGFCIDHRGRLWVAENDSYPKWEEHGKDKIVIFEDTDGDGKFDKRTVFAEGFHYITGVQVGMGGVWVADCPNLLFFPVKEGEDKPSGEPEIKLDGWNWKGQHNVPNSLTWGPDGWLYGCNGITVDSVVGAPGTPADQRVKINCGVWRYHPTKKIFERYAEGTTNPWGLDYDEHGQMFMSNNVVAHLWHVMQGAHYERMRGNDFDPYIFAQIKTIADHLHWGGGVWTSGRGGEANDAAGGGHSHAGLMLYYGEAFPPEYRGSAFMCNTHGHRMNNDALERKGSGFLAHHRPDFMLANDKWFKGVSVQQGPDGSIYFIDWSDTGECHDYDVTDREHGRIYRVAYKGTKAAAVDLTKESDEKLVEMQTSKNEWLARHARIVLRDRGLKGDAKSKLTAMFDSDGDAVHRLRAMWTLHLCGAIDEGRLMKGLADSDEYVRGWAIQLLAEDKQPPTAALAKFEAMAKEDASPVVRLYLASAMQRTPIQQRRGVMEALLAHEEDATDQNLPLMYWYALEPVVGADKKGAVEMLSKVKIAKVRELIARRMAMK